MSGAHENVSVVRTGSLERILCRIGSTTYHETYTRLRGPASSLLRRPHLHVREGRFRGGLHNWPQFGIGDSKGLDGRALLQESRLLFELVWDFVLRFGSGRLLRAHPRCSTNALLSCLEGDDPSIRIKTRTSQRLRHWGSEMGPSRTLSRHGYLPCALGFCVSAAAETP
jgi:hypothetical protein